MTKSHKSSGNGKSIDNPSCLQSIQSDKIKKESLDDGKRKWRLVSQWEKEETDSEKYLRIKEANDAKEKRMSDRAIKKLKREGKVRSIAGFLVCKDEADDDWTKLKMARYKKKRHHYLHTTTIPSVKLLSIITITVPLQTRPLYYNHF